MNLRPYIRKMRKAQKLEVFRKVLDRVINSFSLANVSILKIKEDSDPTLSFMKTQNKKVLNDKMQQLLCWGVQLDPLVDGSHTPA